MRFMLTNDDGIDAPGIALFEEVAREVGDITVVAPAEHQSGCSHQLTTGRPVRVDAQASDRFAIHGTPGDCARIGLVELANDVDWVLSGVNAGGNLGVDTWMSGTVAAAREAALLGYPAIAFSLYRVNGGPTPFDAIREWVADTLQLLWSRPLPKGSFWNVNFPDPRELSGAPTHIDCEVDYCCPLAVTFDKTPDGLLYQSDYHNRPRCAGKDVDVCFSGQIAVSRIDWPPI